MTAVNEREYVRGLAWQVAEIAAGEENALIQRRWRDVNALRRPDRSPVWCRPVGAWAELLPDDSLLCSDPWLRAVETRFRMIMVKHDIGDDSPVEPYFAVPAVFDYDPPTVWGVEIRHHATDDPGGAYAFDPPLRDAEDFDRLQLPRLTYDRVKTDLHLSQAYELLGDIMPVKLVCDAPLTATLGHLAAELRGLGQMMLDMAAEPELMHRLMAYLRDGVLGAMRQVEATGLLTPNNVGPMVLSDPIGPVPADGRLTYKHLWVQANSQEFEQVSPAMWEEFCLSYQLPIIEQFGLAAYGCCENLTRKIDGVLKIPNLRIFVCSGWTDLDAVIDRVGSRYTIMWRQRASEVVFPDDVTSIERHLDAGTRRLQGCYAQIVLRELQTLAGHTDRLHVWTRLAKAAAEKHA